MTVVLAFVVGALAARYVAVAGAGLMHNRELARLNYRDHVVPTAGGLLLVAAVLLVEAGRSTLGALGLGDPPGENTARTLLLAACLGFGLLGFVDDLLGTPHDRGFAGHVRALAEGRISTGALKLLGGGGLALVLTAARAS